MAKREIRTDDGSLIIQTDGDINITGDINLGGPGPQGLTVNGVRYEKRNGRWQVVQDDD